MQNFRTKLRKIRIDKDFSQTAIAFELGISQEAYRKLENGTTKINAEHLDKLAQAFKMDLIEMISYQDEKYNISKPKNNVSVVNNGTIENPKPNPEEQNIIQQILKQNEILLAQNQQLILTVRELQARV